MWDFFTRFGEFAARLLSGGTLEIVLLIVLIVVAVVLLLVALWLLWKLAGLLGKGLLWLFRTGSEAARQKTSQTRAARLAAPPAVSTGWGSSSRIGLRKALAEARRRAGPDSLNVVVISGDGTDDLCRSLGLTPPAVGSIGIAAGGDVVLIDATRADLRRLRALGGALPWRRPIDGVAAILDAGGIPDETLVRTATFARAAGLRAALHFVVAGASEAGAWRIIDSNNHDGGDICTQLAQDAARVWLAGGPRRGLTELSLAQSTDLPSAIDRVLAAAPASAVDIASLSLGGDGLRSALARCAGRTRPADTPALSMWLGVGALVTGIALAILVGVRGLDRADELRSTVATAGREAGASWSAAGIDAVPSGSRVRRVAGVAARLSEQSRFSPLMPLSSLVPRHHEPARLGESLLDVYVLRPLAVALDRHSAELLAPGEDPAVWLGDAQRVSEWLTAWDALADDPREVDIRRLLADAFGGDPASWPDGIDIALSGTGAALPTPERGGLDIDRLTDLAQQNFITTMQYWAESVYTNGPAAVAARAAADRSENWREQHRALTDLRSALQDPGQQWLTAAEDRPDYGYELRMLGRALALSVLGQASALEAKAAVSRIRIDARRAAEHFILPQVGALMVRSSTGAQGAGGGPSLALSPQARDWLAFLDRIASAGFADMPRTVGAPISGPVTIDTTAVAATLGKLQTFDRFGSDLPAGLPPPVARDLLQDVASELVIGVAASVDGALRPAVNVGIAVEDATRLVSVTPALDDLAEIEAWLRQRGAAREADRILATRSRVAENVLAAGAQVLATEDPLGVYLDPSADSNALVRRFERGVVRLRRLYEQFGAPYVAAATLGGNASAFQWRDIGRDLAGFDRGDAGAALSGLEGMLRAWADDPDRACGAPRAALAAARDDYVARALVRFRAQVDRACGGLVAGRAQQHYEDLKAYFRRNVAWMWPYAHDDEAPELTASTLSEFVSRVQDALPLLAQFQGSYVDAFRRSADFWRRDEDGAAMLRFRVDWRARPGEERLAEHAIAFDFIGVQQDEGGLYTWHYGTPVALKVRLAKNSPYRFADPADAAGFEYVVDNRGNGALLRIFDGVSNGAFEVRTELLGADGRRVPFLATARVGDEAGAPLALPRFDAYPPVASDPDPVGAPAGD